MPLARHSYRRNRTHVFARHARYLIDAGKLLWVYCCDRCHERDMDPATVPLPSDTPVPDVGKRMKCSKCGSRNVTTTPEQYPGGVIAMRARRM